MSDCTPKTRIGVCARGYRPAASAGKCGAGLAGGGCVRALTEGFVVDGVGVGIGVGVGVVGESPNAIRDGSVMSNKSIAFEM